jgi:hypothetical protein
MKGFSKRYRLPGIVLLVLLGGAALVFIVTNPALQPGRNARRGPVTEGYYSSLVPVPTLPPDSPLPKKTAVTQAKPVATITAPATDEDAGGGDNESEPRDPVDLGDYSKDGLKQVLSNETLKPTPGLFLPGNVDLRYSPIAPPSISFETFKRVLEVNNSPALSEAASMYNTCLREHCDPAMALAFFNHESSLGTRGVAVYTKSMGNIRCRVDPCYQTQGNGAFQIYGSWTEGLQSWAVLLRETYLAKWNLVTVDQIIPRYAPGEQAIQYIKTVKKQVDNLRLYGRLY